MTLDMMNMDNQAGGRRRRHKGTKEENQKEEVHF